MTNDDRPGDPSRVPPHSIEAEEGLLGAAMLDAHALEVLATRTKPDEFYRPWHRTVADALVAQYGRDTAVDAVTTWAELERLGLAGRIPEGPGAIVGLMARGSVGMVDRYASIIHDHAVLRHLAAAGASISELAFSREDPATATRRAAELVDELASGSSGEIFSTLEVADLASLLEGDLEVEDPQILNRTDGRSLLYAGKMNEIHAEPSAGKTWLALTAVLEVVRIGGAAIYVDWEDTARGILGRLLALGATPAELRESFSYVQPAGALGPVELGELERLVAGMNPDLIVLDGVAEALAKDGLDEGSNSDVVEWFNRVPRMLARTGAGILLLDHVVKDREKSGRYSRGASAKLAAIDGVTYEMKVLKPFSRTSAGTSKLVVAKDRPGGVGAIGETAALMGVHPAGDGARVEVRLEVDTKEVSTSDPWKPSILMEKISRELENSTIPLTASAVKSMIHSDKPKLVTDAIRRLLAEGYVREVKNGRTLSLHLVKPFRHDLEPKRPEEPPPPDEPPPPALFDDEELFGTPDNVTPGPWPGSEDS